MHLSKALDFYIWMETEISPIFPPLFSTHSYINNRFFSYEELTIFCLTGKYILTYYVSIARNGVCVKQ